MKNFFSLFPMGLLAVLLLALRLPATAQAPAWQSARAVAVATTAASGNSSYVTAIAVDAAGNVFLAGAFWNTVALGTTTLTSVGNTDLFVAKFNPASNQFVWAQRAGGTDYDAAAALAVNGANVYVAGYFSSRTANFGPVTLTNEDANTGSSDVFVAKLTDAGSTGSFAWAQRAGGASGDVPSALAVSGSSVYVAGYYSNNTASFGATTLANLGYSDGFVAKLTDAGSTGSFAWAQRIGGRGIDVATGLAVSGSSVYVVGGFENPTASFGTITLTSAGGTDGFVAKLTDAGSFVWAQRGGGVSSDGARRLAVSGSSVYVAGQFGSSTADFGTITLANAGGTAGTSDVFVAKLTDAGSFVWAQQAGGLGNENANSLVLNSTSVYVAGVFASSTASFGPTTLTNAGADDVFVTKLTDVGATSSFAWAQRAGGSGTDAAAGLSISGTSVYMAGTFYSSIASFSTTTLTNSNSNNPLGFLASLTDPTLTATTAAAVPREPAQLYPNPAHHAATLRLPAGTAPAPLVLTDALGRPVRRYPTPAGPEAVLDLHGLPAGLYLLRGAGPAQRLAVE